MAEPEGLIIDAARQATAFVSRLWDHDNNVPDNSCTLSACRQRLEFLLSAVHGHAVSLRVAQTPPPPSALSRLFGRIPRHLIETRPLPANDGAAIFLPMQLDPGEQGELSPHHSFRLLALQQAGRARRQAQQMVPADVIPPSLALALKPEDSLGWAVEMSMKISTRIEVPAGRYYHKEGAIVRLQPPLLGDAAWAESIVARRPALLRQGQLRLEGLRPRRIRYHRQPEGEEIDINACVNAFAERQAGLPPQDRLYQSVKAARRDIAVALLIDISGSTDGWVSQSCASSTLKRKRCCSFI